MTVLGAFAMAVETLQEFFQRTQDKHLWTERDVEYQLGYYLQQELDRGGFRLRVHFGVPLSTGDWMWWPPKNYPKAAACIEKVMSRLGGAGKRIDLVVYDDEDTTDRVPLFPVACEVKYAYPYGGTPRDTSYVKSYLNDRDKLRNVKQEGLAEEVCFVWLDRNDGRTVEIVKGWDPVRVYPVLFTQG